MMSVAVFCYHTSCNSPYVNTQFTIFAIFARSLLDCRGELPNESTVKAVMGRLSLPAGG